MIDFLRGKYNAVDLAKALAASNEVVMIAAPTLMELATGTALTRSSREKEQLSAFLSSVTVLPLDGFLHRLLSTEKALIKTK